MKHIHCDCSMALRRILFFLVSAHLFPAIAWSVHLPPRLLSPNNGAALKNFMISLRWESARQADAYEVEIKDETGRVLYLKKTKGFHIHLNPETQPPGKGFPIMKINGGGCYFWRVRGFSGAVAGSWSDAWMFITPPECSQETDNDCDGIPDAVEIKRFKTDPRRKTLFVRPCIPIKKKKCDEAVPASYYNDALDACYTYWSDFYSGIFPGGKNGRAAIPAFEEAGIEVMVLGAEDNPCEAFRGESGFGYRPEENANQPCDILEIIADASGPPDGYGGSTYFAGNRWTWSPLGHSSGIGYQSEYGVAVVYLYSVNRYFEEGPYRKIVEGEVPTTLDCRQFPGKCNGVNPNNLNDHETQLSPPFFSTPDNTVEFNDIVFDTDGTIQRVGKRGRPFTKAQVIARILVHEMGHALLGLRHCQNPCCVLHEETRDWETRVFGPFCPEAEKKRQSCIHGKGGRRDIRKYGVIHNR